MRFIYLIFTFLSIFGCAEINRDTSLKDRSKDFEACPSPKFHISHEPKKQNAAFSDVVQVGNTFYLSGQIGMDHSTRILVEGGITSETIQTLENIKEVLTIHNLKMTDVVKVMVVLDDITNFSAFNAVYTTYFPQKPARTSFAASALAKGALIEIEVIAVKSN